MFVLYSSTGSISAVLDGTNPKEILTHVPPGLTALYLDDTQYANVKSSPQSYVIQQGAPAYSPVPAATLLENSQTAQIMSLRAGYAQTIAGGFQATIGGTTHTFGWSTDDKANLSAVQQAVNQSFLSFPLQYSDINGSPVTLSSQSDLNIVEQTATKFFNAQHQQVLTLIGQVQAQTSVPATPVAWTPATY